MGARGRALIALVGMAALGLVALRLGLGARAAAGTGLQLLAVAAALAIVAGVLVAAAHLWRAAILAPSAVETIRISGMVFGIVIAASMLALVFRGLGGDRAVEHLMRGLPGGETGALILVMGLVFLLGFLLEAIEIIYIVVPLLGPAILGGDISPVWFAVLLAMNLQTSFLTPPFGFALFYFRSVAPRDITTGMIYRGVIPFVLLQLVALAIVAAVPELATWLPRQIFG
jgi:TRAP-type mannitol/chloroaromatic compound transport system permease large subunit